MYSSSRAGRFLACALFATGLTLIFTTSSPAQMSAAGAPAQQIITTAAGGALCSPNSAGGPISVAVDSAGNQYFTAGSRVCRLSRAGELSLIAGNATYGFFGDGGPAPLAELNTPTGIALDKAGNLYIADNFNARVRKVTVDGKISTVAGNGSIGYAGDGGRAIEAALNRPSGVAVDASGAIYIADSANNVVRKVASDGTITTMARGLLQPNGVAVDDTGSLYIADTGNSRIEKISSDGVIRTVGGSGGSGFSGDGFAATAAELFHPGSVAIDRTGVLYIADTGNSRIRRVSLSGIIDTLAGDGIEGFAGDGGVATAARFSAAWGIAADNAGNVYVADEGNYRIREIKSDGTIISSVSPSVFWAGYSGDGGPATLASLIGPNGVAVDHAGHLYIAETGENRIREVTNDGIIGTIAGTGVSGHTGDDGVATAAELSYPNDATFDGSGNLYIADMYGNSIRKVANGVITTVAGNGTPGYSGDGGPASQAQLNEPSGASFDNAGAFYIADAGNNRIRKVAVDGTISTVAGDGSQGFIGDGGVATQAQLNNPERVLVDPNGNLYIADTGNNVVRKISADGLINTIAGTGSAGFAGDGGPATVATLNHPSGLTIDGVGTLYIADSGNNRVRTIDTRGIIHTLAGNGIAGYSGNNGPPSSAQLNFPTGLALDAEGNLYIADSLNKAVRKVSKAQLYVPLSPARLLDSRIGNGYTTIDGVAQGEGPVPTATVYRLPVTGRAMIPAHVVAVALNVTPINPVNAGYVTVWSGSGPQPNASNLNLNPGTTLPNLVISPVDADGNVALFNGSGGAQEMLADVEGYFPSGSAYVPTIPQRYLDTRSGYQTVDGQTQGIGALLGGATLSLNIAGRTSIPIDGAGAAILNLTAVLPVQAGYLTIWARGEAQPNASNLNFNSGLTIPNLAISGLASNGVSLFNGSSAPMDLLADVQGWFPNGSGYMALPPARLLDTRNGASTIDGQFGGTGGIVANASLQLQVLGRGGVPLSGVGAVVLNVTSVLPAQSGFITVWPTGSSLPLTSNLNLNPGMTVANLVLAKIGNDGQISIFNGSQGSIDVAVDVAGWMPASP